MTYVTARTLGDRWIGYIQIVKHNVKGTSVLGYKRVKLYFNFITIDSLKGHDGGKYKCF